MEHAPPPHGSYLGSRQQQQAAAGGSSTSSITDQTMSQRTTPSLSPPPSPGGGRSPGPSSTSAAFINVGFTSAALVDSLLQPLRQEMRTNISDKAQAEALRNAFCLPPGQVMLAQYLCARRKPGGWDSGVVMQGQLLVFSGCLVFQSNILGHVKFKTIWFENGEGLPSRPLQKWRGIESMGRLKGRDECCRPCALQ